MLTFFGRIAFLSFFGLAGLATIAFDRQPQPDHAAYQQCIKLHPERYCGIEHLGRR